MTIFFPVEAAKNKVQRTFLCPCFVVVKPQGGWGCGEGGRGAILKIGVWGEGKKLNL